MKKLAFMYLLFFIITSCSSSNQNEIIENNSLPTELTSTQVFIAIHMEPGVAAKQTSYPQQYWDNLVSLVELADDYNIKLTLCFNPQWATYILADEERLSLVRSWEANGHEIGLHHHGPHMGSWDGYTNQESYKSNKEYIGSIEDMMNLLNQVPTSGLVKTGVISDDEDQEYDWPEQIIYGLNGGANRIEDLGSIPFYETDNNIEHLSLTHAQYNTNSQVAVSLDVIKEYMSVTPNEIIGIVFHEKNYAENPDAVRILFEYLDSNNFEVKTASDILDNY